MTDESITPEAGVDDVPIDVIPWEGLPATDKFFQAGSSYIKVRRTVENLSFGIAVVILSGSECDAEGWAKQDETGFLITAEERQTIQPDRAVADFGQLVAGYEIECVKTVLRAIKVREAATALRAALGQS